MNISLKFGNFTCQIDYPEDFSLPENISLFRCSDEITEYTYTIRIVDTLPEISGEFITRRHDLIVLKNSQYPSLESRIIGVKGCPEPYAIYQEVSEEHAEITFLRRYLYETTADTIFVSLLSLERRMIKKNGLILHCAYIRYQNEAILFSAPSETGKSTQADLWEKYRGSVTVNGDKSLLQKINGTWIARGWPICGSSEICHNEDTPVKAIVMLSQSIDNHSGRLRPIEAFQKLYSQITINSWNAETINHTMNLIEDLQSEIPVYYLACNMTEDAVTCLEHTIYH